MERQVKKEPVYDYDAVNKKYVDKKINELKKEIEQLLEQLRNGG